MNNIIGLEDAERAFFQFSVEKGLSAPGACRGPDLPSGGGRRGRGSRYSEKINEAESPEESRLAAILSNV